MGWSGKLAALVPVRSCRRVAMALGAASERKWDRISPLRAGEGPGERSLRDASAHRPGAGLARYRHRLLAASAGTNPDSRTESDPYHGSGTASDADSAYANHDSDGCSIANGFASSNAIGTIGESPSGGDVPLLVRLRPWDWRMPGRAGYLALE